VPLDKSEDVVKAQFSWAVREHRVRRRVALDKSEGIVKA
jgi:hypothetical protein